jgi:hypothetical protein
MVPPQKKKLISHGPKERNISCNQLMPTTYINQVPKGIESKFFVVVIFEEKYVRRRRKNRKRMKGMSG